MSTLIRTHPIISFFVMSCALSWLGWLNYILSNSGLGIIDVDYPVVFGSTQLLGVIPGAYLGPIGSALIITALADGRAGLKAWVGRLLRWRVNWRWYAVSLLAVPTGLIVLGGIFSGGLITVPSLMLLAAYAPILVLQMLTTGLAEEPGWRDFALSRLQRRFGPMASAAILGPVWALWHYPLFLTDWAKDTGQSWMGLLSFTIFCIGFNVVMSWVFNRTNESLPLSMLTHVSVNTFASVLWPAMFPSMKASYVSPALAVGAVVAAITTIIVTRGQLGYRAACPQPESGMVPTGTLRLGSGS